MEEKEQALIEERTKYPLEQRLRDHIVGQEGPISVVGSGERVHAKRMQLCVICLLHVNNKIYVFFN